VGFLIVKYDETNQSSLSEGPNICGTVTLINQLMHSIITVVDLKSCYIKF